MSEKPRNIPASIHARLTKEARKSNRPFSEVLQYYGIERFLYRLFQTKYKEDFILKGGLLIYSWGISMRRPTRDIDFLSLTGNQVELISNVITDAISLSVPEDGINFDTSSLSIEETQVDADRTGIRVRLTGYLARARIPLQIDIGFSDELSSTPVVVNYPVVLNDMSGFQVNSYPAEMVVAEKFHTIERYAALPSRWKDYYDLWLISERFRMDDQSLRNAISKTFEKRATKIPEGRPVSLSDEFINKYHGNWEIFLKKSGLQVNITGDLKAVVEQIRSFLEKPLQELKSSDIKRVNWQWSPEAKKWKKI